MPSLYKSRFCGNPLAWLTPILFFIALTDLIIGTAAGQAKYHLCAISNLQNDAFYITQWLAYHKAAGFDHFYLSDDCSTDRTVEFINTAIVPEGYVSFYPPTPCLAGYQFNETANIKYLAQEAKKDCEYIVVMKVNEFITRQDDVYSAGNFNKYLMAKSPDHFLLFGQMLVHKNVKKPGFLLLNREYKAKLAPQLHRTVIRSRFVKDWENLAYPSVEGLGDESLQKAVEQASAPQSDFRTLNNGTHVVHTYTYPFIINQYAVKSLTENMCDHYNRGTIIARSVELSSEHPLFIYNNLTRTTTGTPAGAKYIESLLPEVKQELLKIKTKHPFLWQFSTY